jgi:hypothetical protein
MDTDTDAIRVHVPGRDGSTDLNNWLDARDVYEATCSLRADAARARIQELVEQAAASQPDAGMVQLVARLIEHNLSQIDYVRQYHGGSYSDYGHAERFIGVGIGFKEVHLRNLTYFAYMDTVEDLQGAECVAGVADPRGAALRLSRRRARGAGARRGPLRARESGDRIPL